MTQQPSTCEGCPLHDDKIGIGFMSPEGLGSSGVLVIAEALGQREATDSLPLRPNAPAGSIFSGIIRRISGLDRAHLLLSNTIWCQPGVRNYLDGAPYEYAAIEHCQQYNAKLIRDRKPRAIVTLGAIPTRTITGMSGYKQGIGLIRGYVLHANRPEYIIDGEPIPVIPTFHPSYLLRASKTRSKDKEVAGKVEKAEGGMALSGVMMRDISLALRIAREGFKGYRDVEAVRGTREVMERLIWLFTQHPEWDMAWDIETSGSKETEEDEREDLLTAVTQIQFGFDSKTGYVFPGFNVEWVKDLSQKLLRLPNRKLTWNGKKFDNKVVRINYNFDIQGEDCDLMEGWHHVQPDIPKNLQFATSFAAPDLRPWKHLFLSDEDEYGANDVIALILNRDSIFETMKSRGLRNAFDRHVIMLQKPMDKASDRGFPVDEKRHNEFGTKVFGEITKVGNEIRLLIPEDILNLEPKRKATKSSITEYGYINTPKQLLPFLSENGKPKDGSDRVQIRELVVDEDESGDDGEKSNEGQRVEREVVVTYVVRSVSTFNKKTLENETIERWCRLVPFSVGSPQQRIKYIEYKRAEEIAKRLARGKSKADSERLAKYVVPKVRNKNKELKDNTGAKEMEKLFKATGDPVFQKLIDIGKLKKIHGTYVKGWEVKDGAVHTTFGLAATGTGQLSSVEPNIQNAPKHSALGKEFRFCIAAKPGKILLEFDKKAFHAQTLAFEAKDKAYARLSAIDIHSFMTAHRLKLPEAHQLLTWSDADLIAWIKDMKASPRIYKSEAGVAYPDGMTFQEVRDFKSKRVILGIGFAQGAQSIFEQNPESYKNKSEVQQFLDLFSELFKPIRTFQASITQLAHKQTHLISRWGYIRRFYDVFKWDSNKWNEFTGSMGDWSHGDDFEAAVAFLPANDAFGMIKEEILRLEEEGAMDRYGFVNQIHDSLMFHCDFALRDSCIEDVLRVMRQPCIILSDPDMAPNGLFVDAAAQIGEDWAHMKEIKGV